MELKPLFDTINLVAKSAGYDALYAGQDYPIDWDKGYITLVPLTLNPLSIGRERSGGKDDNEVISSVTATQKAYIRIEAGRYYNASKEFSPIQVLELIRANFYLRSTIERFKEAGQAVIPSSSAITSNIYSDNTTWRHKATLDIQVNMTIKTSESDVALKVVDLAISPLKNIGGNNE